MQWRSFFRQRTIRVFMAICLCVLSSSLLSCQKSEKIEPVKIGVIAYLEGALRETEGLPTLDAATMALADFEAQGGLVINGEVQPVELIVERVEQTQEASVAATRKLINRIGVSAIVGPMYSSDAIPAGALAEKAGVPMICPVSTNPKTTAGRKFVFRMSFLDDAQGEAIAAVALNDLGAKSAAVLFDEADDYSREIATVFRDAFARQGEVVAFESYVTGDSDFAQQLWRIRAAEPDVLYLPGYHHEVVEQAGLIKRLGIDAVLLGADGWDQRQMPLLRAFDDSYFSLHWNRQIPTGETKLFFTRYVETFKREPNGTAALTYDAVQMLLLAMQQQQKTTPDAIRNGLMQLKPYSGVGGLIDFVDSGDPEKPVLIMHVKDGETSFFKAVMR